jgi:hypothetical protein
MDKAMKQGEQVVLFECILGLFASLGQCWGLFTLELDKLI